MARSRSLEDLRNDAYKRADCENATDRHPSADVSRYVNQGAAEVYDLLVEARGRRYFRASQTITTTAATTDYPLEDDFYKLIGVRRQGDMGDSLLPFGSADEPFLREPTTVESFPTHYEIQGENIVLLPLHLAGVTIVVDYVPAYTDMVADDDTFDGINGWEEYVVCFAARCMAVKDAEWELARALENDMAKLKDRILKLAPNRDGFRADRVKDVRSMSWRARWGRWPL